MDTRRRSIGSSSACENDFKVSPQSLSSSSSCESSALVLPGFSTEYQGAAASGGEVGEGEGVGGAAGFDIEATLAVKPTLWINI